MPRLAMSIPHALTPETALERVKGLLEGIKAEHGDKISDLRENWHGYTGNFSFRAMGFSITNGCLTVNPGVIQLSADLPWAANFFKGKIEATIRSEAAKRLVL